MPGERVGEDISKAYFVVVSFEQGEEGSLGTSRSLDSSESNIISSSLNVPKIHQKFLQNAGRNQLPFLVGPLRLPPKTNLNPQSSPLSNRGQLSRLKVGPSQRR